MSKFQVELSEDLYNLINIRVSKFHKSLFAELALRCALNDDQIMKNIPHKNKKSLVNNDNEEFKPDIKSFTIDDDFR